jgi:D-alanyl-lipoteichoic acid acyltransferase DltB (MBOAT superfamily)
MALVEPVFLLFALVACLVYRSTSRYEKLRPFVLVGLSLFFYSTWNPWYCLPITVTALLDFNTAWLLVRTTNARKRSALLTTDILINLGILAVFKYFNFLHDSAAPFYTLFGRSLPPAPFRVVFMVGISFYTFQSMSYVIDVYRGEQKPARDFMEYFAFVSFFPTLLAGPITRARVLLTQLQQPASALTDEQGSRALMMIARGFIKKLVFADYLSVNLVDRAFELPRMFSSLEILIAVYAFAVQIYCDFSGYSDIAIGTAQLLGFKLPDNFNAPYRSESLVEFWRRWHISFSTWLRDYIFFALPSSRRAKWRLYWNTFITFALGGIWHGASWNFLIWGMMHGFGLAVNHGAEALFPRRGKQQPKHLLWRIGGVLLTFHFVCITWIFFRCDSTQQALDILSGIAQGTTGWVNIPWPVPVMLALAMLAQWLPDQWYQRAESGFAKWPAAAQAAALAGVAMLIAWTSHTAVTQFIYFKF